MNTQYFITPTSNIEQAYQFFNLEESKVISEFLLRVKYYNGDNHYVAINQQDLKEVDTDPVDDHIVLPTQAINEVLSSDDKIVFYNLVEKVQNYTQNAEYIVVNKDEPYAEQICNIINAHNKKQIIAFVGRAGSGKDYQCAKLLTKGFTKLAFADALRKIAFSTLGISYEDGMNNYDYLKNTPCIEVNLAKSNYVDNPQPKFNFRTFLEKLGTEGIRKYDDDFWANCLVNEIKKSKLNKVCVSDLRFPNEYHALNNFAKQNGYEFKCVFCDYHSDRYQDVNDHDSAKLSNWLCAIGMEDLNCVTESVIKQYETETQIEPTKVSINVFKNLV